MPDRNDQYRRPRPHFTAEEPRLITRWQLLAGSAAMLGLALLLILALVPLQAQAPDITPDTAQVHQDAAQALAEDCAVLQQLTYAPCGHRVTRRLALPAELVGKGLTELSAAYDGWQITAFAPAEVSMSRTFAIFCPQHTVLLPDESGMLCAWQNKYGDALALVKELGVAASELPDSAQDEARQGKGFDSPEALEKWLESVES